MHEVLERMEPAYHKALEKIWQKNKEKLLYKSEEEERQGGQESQQIQYEHLPLIREKMLGVYEPFVIKNMLTPETNAANRYAVEQFTVLLV